MKRSILATAFVAATFWIANTPAFAQHGRPASPGAVAPSMHGGASSGESHASSRPTTSPSSPDAVLSRNSHLSGALSRSEEHTSELQSRFDLVCRLLLEKKKNNKYNYKRLGRTGISLLRYIRTSPNSQRALLLLLRSRPPLSQQKPDVPAK